MVLYFSKNGFLFFYNECTTPCIHTQCYILKWYMMLKRTSRQKTQKTKVNHYKFKINRICYQVYVTQWSSHGSSFRVHSTIFHSYDTTFIQASNKIILRWTPYEREHSLTKLEVMHFRGSTLTAYDNINRKNMVR